MQQLQTIIYGVIRGFDVQTLPRETQTIVAKLKREIADARLDIRDAEFADTAVEYKRHVAEAKVRLIQVNKAILVLSSEGLFRAVEVAELSAKLEQLSDEL
jgi:hypothetical protein